MSKTPVDKGEVMFAILALDGADHHAMANLTRRLWSEIETHRADLAAAAGELLVALPKPGSVIAKLLHANVLMRSERDKALATVRTEEREACARVLDALAAGVRWHETGDARVDAMRRRGAETTRSAYEQGARDIRERGDV